MASSRGPSPTMKSWDELRKQARTLENELDVKLVAFSKMGFGNSMESTPLLSDDSFNSAVSEIEQLLSKLGAVNDEMAEVSLMENPQDSARQHTIQRHRDIQQDFSKEFQRTRSNMQARREREDLLRVYSRSNYKQTSGLNRRMDLYLKESEHIRSSERMIDEQINIAMETRDHLHGQRAAFKMIQTKMNDLTNRFPMINSLVQRTTLRKRRDSIILGSVIGICTVLLLLYAFG
ncbi:unnamed protein product [Darwinula stevensoni]|uniref:Golgi SNAP receptor complex member 1 n=1 Tax=Darwinula stevensoni TaxID=69355 RepID=A0A7R8X3V2_9CRUS|nr:unnamed protein product [Darwinula stevensoni]CAG0882751.1 unnamed protein product [Darwinula stevensoni]